MTVGKPIALGRTAEVYPWADGQVLKLFRPRWGKQAAEFEAHIARAVYAAGLPAPAVGEVIEVDGRFGLTYARVDGPLLGDVALSKPWRAGASARAFADLHAKIHACVLPELPSQRQRLESRLRSATTLPPRLKEAVLRILYTLPEGDWVCHGDFHPENVVITGHGPMIIDWTDATRGNPLADVARTSLLLQVSGLPPAPGRWLVAAVRSWFLGAYLQRYRQLASYNEEEITAWQPVIAAARLKEEIPDEADRLLKLVEAARL